MVDTHELQVQPIKCKLCKKKFTPTLRGTYEHCMGKHLRLILFYPPSFCLKVLQGDVTEESQFPDVEDFKKFIDYDGTLQRITITVEGER